MTSLLRSSHRTIATCASGRNSAARALPIPLTIVILLVSLVALASCGGGGGGSKDGNGSGSNQGGGGAVTNPPPPPPPPPPAAPPPPLLQGKVGAPPAGVNLTAQGTADWVHWARNSEDSVNRKSDVIPLISSFTQIAGGRAPRRFTDAQVATSWSDGKPIVAQVGATTGLFFRDLGNGYELRVRADSVKRTLRLYIGGFSARGRLTASLSDNSAPPYSAFLENQTDVFTNVVTIDFRAKTDGETLLIRYTVDAEFPAGNVTLIAATLSGPVGKPLLPFSDNFSDGNFDDWTIVDNSGDPSDWNVTGGRLHQSNNVENRRDGLDETYQLGTYAYLGGYEGATNYRLFAEMRSNPAAGSSGNGFGLMFRYQDDNNYYRISFNSRYSHARLERKFAGVMRTIATACLTAATQQPALCVENNPNVEILTRAVDARGYLPGQSLAVLVEVVGGLIRVSVDPQYDGVTFNGEARFAARETRFLSGTIGLYAQDQVSFDNVLLQETNSADPNIVIASPLAFSVIDGGPLVVSAVATHTTAAASVNFFVDGILCPPTRLATGIYRANCGLLAPGDHTVEAILTQGATIRQDTNTVVGSGDYRATVGDSITNGVDDNFATDNLSADGRQVGIQGYQAVLSDLLTSPGALGVPQIVFNEGVGGDDSFDLVFDRIDSVLRRHPGASTVQLLIATNDAPGALFTPSGLGCTYSDPPAGHQQDPAGVPWPSDCAATVKGNIQWAVNKVLNAGKTPIVAEIPPAFGNTVSGAPYNDPVNGVRNQRVRDYNQVIRTELVGRTLGPNFYDYFLGNGENRYSLFDDNVHPNSLGYVLMAHLWRDTLAGPGVLPLVLDDICVRDNPANAICQSPLSYKQNLMEVGNRYFVDEAYTLVSIPSVLNGGVWINGANAHRTQTRGDFLEFTVDRAVKVYVGYDASATFLPAWLAGFPQVFAGGQQLEIQVSDPNTPGLRLFRRDFGPSTITLGGAASGATGAASNYVVIVRE